MPETRDRIRTPSLEGMSAEGLAALSAQNDHAAFAVLFRRFELRVYRMALKSSRNPAAAQEIMVSTFMKAFSHLRRRATWVPDDFGGWLFTIALNEARSHFRRESSTRASVPFEDVDVESSGPSPEAALAFEEERQVLKQFAERIPGEQRRRTADLLLNNVVESAEIAAELDVSEHTARRHKSDVRKTMAEIWQRLKMGEGQ